MSAWPPSACALWAEAAVVVHVPPYREWTTAHATCAENERLKEALMRKWLGPRLFEGCAISNRTGRLLQRGPAAGAADGHYGRGGEDGVNWEAHLAIGSS